MRSDIVLAVVCLIHCCAYGDAVLPSKTPNVEYILKGKSERVELYTKTSNTNEYLICMDLIASMGRDCFRCSIFINTDCVYAVKQNTYIADMRNEPELTTLQNDRPCGVDVVCEKKVLSPLLLHELKNFLSLKMAPKYERMAWGSGIGHVVVTFQKKGEERVAIYDRPVWRADLDRRKIDFCRDVYGKERADSYASFLRVYRRLMLLLNQPAIQNFWDNFVTNNQWESWGQNCAATVADSLKAGGAEVSWYDWWKSWNIVWSPNDIKDYADAIQSYYIRITEVKE